MSESQPAAAVAKSDDTGAPRRWIDRVEQLPTSVAAILAALSLIVSIVALVLDLSSRPPDPLPIVALIEQEAELTKNQDVPGAVALFVQDDDAIITDRGFNDGQTYVPDRPWIGIDRVRARYEMIASRARFPELEHYDITITFDPSGELARAVSSTEGSMSWDNGPLKSVSTRGGEHWEFRRVEGEWRITSLICHQPPDR
jgi:hypothetical protein